jgi:predicted transcriptional regulator of viral defense system
MRIFDFLSQLARQGKIFTIEDAYKITHINRDYLRKLLYRLEKRGAIERIKRGRYMIIPLYGEKGKYTLNEFIIGSLLVEPYAISYWSALNHYGLTEQIPTTVFIQTISWKEKQGVEVFGVKYRIVRIKKDKFFGTRKEWVEETQINITDKEKTIIDCLDKPQYCGGIIEVTKGLKKGQFDKDKLIVYVDKIGNSGVIRRIGFLCDFLGLDIKLPKVKTKNYLYLDPTMPKKGNKNAKWRLIINLDEKVLGTIE